MRLGYPASVGEIVGGIAMAWAVAVLVAHFPDIRHLTESEVLEMVANLGIFCLVLFAGVELEPREIAKSSLSAFGVALGGVAVPLACGFGLVWILLPAGDLRIVLALLTGVALSISAIPESVKVLTDFGLLRSQVGETIVAAALFDDIIGLFLLAVLLAMIRTGHTPDVGPMLWLLAKVGLFFAITVALGVHVYPRISARLRAMRAAAIEFSVLAAVALAYGLLAEALGMHWIMGAFMAGLYFERERVGAKAYNEMRLILGAVTGGFLGPLFFASIGLRVDLGAITSAPVFLLMLLAVALLGKMAGCGIPALWSGMSRREALAVGVGMNARGAVELVVLSIAFEAGLFARAGGDDPIATNLFSALILVGVVTTALAPLLLQRVLPRGKEGGGPSSRQG